MVHLHVSRQPRWWDRRGPGGGHRAGRDFSPLAPRGPGGFLHGVGGVGVRRCTRDPLPVAMAAPPRAQIVRGPRASRNMTKPVVAGLSKVVLVYVEARVRRNSPRAWRQQPL